MEAPKLSLVDKGAAPAAKASQALTPAQEAAIMERHRQALALADAALVRPLALVGLLEVVLTIAAQAHAVGEAAQAGNSHPLGLYVDRPAKVITHKNEGKERHLIAMQLAGDLCVAVMGAVDDLRAGMAAPPEVEATPGPPAPSVDPGASQDVQAGV